MKTINFSDSSYPALLKKIDCPPKQIYYRGKWRQNIFKNCLAVVGSRRITAYGRQVTAKLISEIAAAGITIVSGFMYGVDACAHKAALAGEGKTIAVMPCGINRIHPAYQKKLYQEILKKGGLIVSETKGEAMPALWSYPRRNRIVAGLSKATLVIEAGLESGSLITAGLTKKFNRKLFALPGPLTSSVSEGTLKLIKEGNQMATSAEDILSYYGFKEKIQTLNKFSNLHLGKLEKRIIEKLKEEPLEIDFLSRVLDVSSAKLGTKLSLLQLKGVVKQEAGKYYFQNR